VQVSDPFTQVCCKNCGQAMTKIRDPRPNLEAATYFHKCLVCRSSRHGVRLDRTELASSILFLGFNVIESFVLLLGR
jgi:hypothetical protein